MRVQKTNISQRVFLHSTASLQLLGDMGLFEGYRVPMWGYQVFSHNLRDSYGFQQVF